MKLLRIENLDSLGDDRQHVCGDSLFHNQFKGICLYRFVSFGGKVTRLIAKDSFGNTQREYKKPPAHIVREIESALAPVMAAVIEGAKSRIRREAEAHKLATLEAEKRERLNKAAPEMLATLKALIEWGAQTGEWEAECWQRAKDVIAKAEAGE